MDLGKFHLGEDVLVDVALAEGAVVVKVEIKAKDAVDKLLDEVKGKLPDYLKLLVDLVKQSADNALA